MPELPEVEHLRRTLAPNLVGSRVLRVNLRRRDVVRQAGSRRAIRGVGMSDLLEGATIVDIQRRGKSLVMVGSHQRVLALHLGMTGNMSITPGDAGATLDPRRAGRRSHVHCEWLLRSADNRSLCLRFRDPRRFGGLWPFASMDDLHARAWSRLGPDALGIGTHTLRERLHRTRQPIKAALLNQALVAGIGNIYADEALFAARIHPRRRPTQLKADEWPRLAKAMRDVLTRAVQAGGSTIRDYVDADGSGGQFAVDHRVYGRAGQPCTRCKTLLGRITVGQRTTVFCTRCQRV